MREYANLGLRLMIICLVAALALSGINSLTAPIIKEQENARVNAARLELIPDASDFIKAEDLSFAAEKYPEITAAYTAVDASGATIGYVMDVVGKGFGGEITMNVGIYADGTIAGMRIITHGETEGLGANAAKPEYYEQYTNIADTSVVNAMSGATVTSKAVAKAVDKAQAFAMEAGPVLGDPNAELAPVEEVDNGDGAGGEFTAEAQGFGGAVTVTVTFNSDGTINAVAAEGPNETQGIGSMALEADYLDQFIGTTTPTEIDTYSGATFTSTAIITAINDCGAQFGGEAPAANAEASAPAAAGDGAGGEYEAEAQGFGGKVKVVVTFNSDGTIFSVTAEGPAETSGIGSRACEADYLSSFVGTTTPTQVDTLSGATFTSTGIRNAIDACGELYAAAN